MKREFHSNSLSDEELIRLIREDEKTFLFEILYHRYYQKVVNKCYSLLKNKKLTEELTEDIFSKVYEKLSSYKQKSSFSSWLYAICYNQCIDHLREKKKLHYPAWNKKNELPDIIDESLEDLDQINYDNLVQILDMIHTEEKALLLMKYQDNLTLKQISQSLRISEDAAKMRLKRARSRVFYLYKKKFLEL
jgi:RNA polymerase sigma factor (sigma-70 family)